MTQYRFSTSLNSSSHHNKHKLSLQCYYFTNIPCNRQRICYNSLTKQPPTLQWHTSKHPNTFSNHTFGPCLKCYRIIGESFHFKEELCYPMPSQIHNISMCSYNLPSYVRVKGIIKAHKEFMFCQAIYLIT